MVLSILFRESPVQVFLPRRAAGQRAGTAPFVVAIVFIKLAQS